MNPAGHSTAFVLTSPSFHHLSPLSDADVFSFA